MPSPACSKTIDQRKVHTPKNGRPKTWTGTLLRKLVVLDVFSNFTNEQKLQTLRGSTEGTRSLQTLRKKLLGSGHTRWKSRNDSQMHRRILHLHLQLKHGGGLHVSSLDDPELHPSPPLPEPSPASSTDSKFPHGGQTGHDKLEFWLVKLHDSQNCRVGVRIRMSAEDTDDLVETCSTVDTTQALSRMLHSSELRHLGDEVRTSSIILSHIDLTKRRWLDQDDFCELLHDCVTRLEVNNCKLATVPQKLASFSRLRYLNLSRNRLTKIPIMHLPEGLTRLDLRHNRIDKLPEELMGLRSLSVIAVSYNLITELPTWLSEWDGLQVLLVDGNPLDPPSYLHHENAFQYSKKDTMGQSCKNCLKLATRALKGFLSSGSCADTTTEMSCRSCSETLQFEIPSSTSNAINGDEYSALRYLRTSRDADSGPLFKSLFRRMSILSGSDRGSISGLTLDSISSAGLDNLSRLNMDAVMLVHCCWRPQCIHKRIASWVEDGPTTAPPLINPSEVDLEGNSALHIAASFDASPEALNLCIEAGCDPNIINSKGETFLHQVTARNWNPNDIGTLRIILCLRARAFDFGHADHHGNTIFHRSEKWVLAFQKLFLPPDFPGYDPFKRNAFGKRALDLNSSSIEIKSWTKQWMWSRCCSHRPLTSEAAIRLSFQYLDLWEAPVFQAQCESDSCRLGFHVTHRNPLHAFARLTSLGYKRFYDGACNQVLDSATALERVLETGAEVNDYNDDGETTLMLFIRTLGRCQRHLGDVQVEECINMLIAHKANARWYNRNGETALHYAIYYGLPHAIKPLIDVGANVNARNSKGLSVLGLLAETMHKMKSNVTLFASFQQCMAILADHGAEMQPSLEKELQWQVSAHAPSPSATPVLTDSASESPSSEASHDTRHR